MVGKDIYEGDILDNGKYRSVVKFISGAFIADVVGTFQNFNLTGEIWVAKVVGNMHENADLVRSSND